MSQLQIVSCHHTFFFATSMQPPFQYLFWKAYLYKKYLKAVHVSRASQHPWKPKTSEMTSRTHSLNPFWKCSWQNDKKDPWPFRKYRNPYYIFLCHDALSSDPLQLTLMKRNCASPDNSPLPESLCLASTQPALACPKTRILHVGSIKQKDYQTVFCQRWHQ